MLEIPPDLFLRFIFHFSLISEAVLPLDCNSMKLEKVTVYKVSRVKLYISQAMD